MLLFLKFLFSNRSKKNGSKAARLTNTDGKYFLSRKSANETDVSCDTEDWRDDDSNLVLAKQKSELNSRLK